MNISGRALTKVESDLSNDQVQVHIQQAKNEKRVEKQSAAAQYTVADCKPSTVQLQLKTLLRTMYAGFNPCNRGNFLLRLQEMLFKVQNFFNINSRLPLVQGQLLQ